MSRRLGAVWLRLVPGRTCSPFLQEHAYIIPYITYWKHFLFHSLCEGVCLPVGPANDKFIFILIHSVIGLYRSKNYKKLQEDY